MKFSKIMIGGFCTLLGAFGSLVFSALLAFYNSTPDGEFAQRMWTMLFGGGKIPQLGLPLGVSLLVFTVGIVFLSLDFFKK